MFEEDVTTLDATATLAGAEDDVRAGRAVEVRAMRRVLHWCDLHSGDPQASPGAAPPSQGGDQLIQVGGEGTPPVAQLCFAELAIARAAGVVATENFAADCLDLRHRLPSLWGAVQQLEVEGWLARKVARLSRRLSPTAVGLVDEAVTAARHQSAGRLLAIAEAKIIEADPDLHRAVLAEDARRTGVWLSKVRPGDLVEDSGEPATRRVTAKLPNGTAIRCEENIDDLAHALLDHTCPDENGEQLSLDRARVLAFEMLTTDPHTAITLLDGLDQPRCQEARPEPGPAARPEPTARPRRKRRPPTLVVHLAAETLCGCAAGTARVEDHGPVLVEELEDLLGPDRDITVQPVIDLNTVEAVNGYEHPARIARRTLLRTHGDVFPHSTGRGTKRLDLDHATPYHPQGPPGQTGDHNAAPLTRRHHRVKTHLGYQLRQLGLAAYRWTTPHGLHRLVTPRGTTTIEPIRGPDHSIVGELYAGTRPVDLDLVA